jgi:hypothetical protein
MHPLKASHLSFRPRFIQFNSLEMAAVRNVIGLAGGVPPKDDLQLLHQIPPADQPHKVKH